MEIGLTEADAAICLNVSRSVVQRLWDQYQSEDSVSRRHVSCRPRVTTPAEDRFLALSARRRRSIWAGISLGSHTDLHVFHGGTLIGVRYRDEILDPYVRPYARAIGNDFILMDDNALPHRPVVVEDYLESHGLERME
ncbi:hypothetical protein AVEN_23549-1 [Araneus ventricosus]|uniref:Tc1-like transposase DDE domain-containing protein n=1 Tax=Araneus ventricosus TaxID=182803 RepID=A0A4Y2PIM7_ARAVE|nr:hypothetical protein AVEN_23549-1 [Araneus ventricosus]